MSGTATPAAIFGYARRAGLSVRAAITATAIALAESGGRIAARGDVDLEDATWGPSVGLWQVRSWRKQTGTGGDRDVTRLSDPTFNAHAMYDLSSGGKIWGAWSAYTSGAYKEHLDEAQAAARAAGDKIPPGEVQAIILNPDTGRPRLPNVPDLGDLGDAAGDVLGGGVLGGLGHSVTGGIVDELRPVVLTAVFVLGGIALVIAGAAATVRPIKDSIEGAIV
jgi:lysozyme-like protein